MSLAPAEGAANTACLAGAADPASTAGPAAAASASSPAARPAGRVVLGLGLVGLSYLLCWPGIVAAAALAAWTGSPLVLAVAGPLLYGVSWAVWLGGVAIAGTAGLSRAGPAGRWLLRRLGRRRDLSR